MRGCYAHGEDIHTEEKTQSNMRGDEYTHGGTYTQWLHAHTCEGDIHTVVTCTRWDLGIHSETHIHSGTYIHTKRPRFGRTYT